MSSDDDKVVIEAMTTTGVGKSMSPNGSGSSPKQPPPRPGDALASIKPPPKDEGE